MQKKNSNEILKFLLSNIFTLVLLAVSGIILVRILGPSETGRFISIYIIPSMLIRLTMLGSRKTAITHFGEKSYSDNEIVSSLLFIWIFSSLMAVIICTANFAIMQHADMNAITHIFVLSTIPLRLFIFYSISVFVGKTKYNFSNIFKLLPDLLNFIILLVFVSSGNLNIDGAIVAYFFSSLFVAVVCFLMLIRHFKIKFEFNKEIIKSLSTVGFINALTLFVMQLNYRFDIVLLYKYSTTYQVGIYALGTSLALVIWIIPDAIGLIVRKRISKAINPINIKNEIAGFLRVSLVFGILISVIMYFIAPLIFTLIFGDSFKESTVMFRNILPGVFLFIIFRSLNGFLHLVCMPGIIIKIFVPILIVNVILNILWIPLYGGVGAAWASNVSYSLGAITTLIVFSKKMKISLIDIFKFSVSDFSFIKKLSKIGSRKN
jgi:O-antigen/teichoic acid export membrane protein